ncbi:MAG: Spo0B domain-containing protein [Clostridia bacterium]|nr:Spo0B domain-containing protein [Clostridia bacterium]
MSRERNVDVRKVTRFAFAANGLQIVMIVLIALYVLIMPHDLLDVWMVKFIVCIAAAVVIWGAVVDIREATSTKKLLTQLDDMDDAIIAMEGHNNTLRSQRHDFLNHLQVVYSLMEMEEYEEATAYIEKIYGAITAVSRTMKTANPAINALLQVKLAACEKAGIRVGVNIQSAWRNLPMPGWEMCKVLSNLIDNAIDALEEVTDRSLSVTLTEDLKAFRFSVRNNGPMIPVKSRQSIFQPGITTKGNGHGMGLHIVRETLRKHGGDIELVSDAEQTEFAGFVPKEIVPAAVKTEENQA